MSNRRSISAGEESTEVNISPLIDMVFILLIFFIVTTVFVEEEGLDVNKPQPSAATRLWSLAALARQRLESGQIDDLADLQPYYLRMPSIGLPDHGHQRPRRDEFH